MFLKTIWQGQPEHQSLACRLLLLRKAVSGNYSPYPNFDIGYTGQETNKQGSWQLWKDRE